MTTRWMMVFLFMVCTVRAQSASTEKQSGSMIFLRDYGTDDIGYIVVPEKEPSAGVVVLPDRHGVTPAFKKFCEKLALEGYIVLGLDLYNGRIAKDETEAAQMASTLQEKNFSKTLRTGLKFFESSPRFQMEKKMLVAWGESGDVTLKSLSKEKGLLSLVLLDPSTMPEKEKILDLPVPLQVLLPASSPHLPAFQALEPELAARMKKSFEMRVVEKESYIEPLKAFFYRILTDPPSRSLIDKIF